MKGTLDLRVGIDVGGTNTDAVALDRFDKVIAEAKVATSDDVTSGIAQAIRQVVSSPSVEPQRVTHAMLGSTHAANAVLQRRDLGQVAVVRIGAPATFAIPPMATWPQDLKAAVSLGETIIPGGIEIDGTEIVPLDVSTLKEFLDPFLDHVEAIAVVSVFAPVSDRHEKLAGEAIAGVVGPHVPVVLSSEIGSLGLLERENATIMNAALTAVANRITESLGAALAENGIDAITYFSQNDGTLMASDYARSFPVLTVGSGPANSMRGAAYLSGLTDAIVIDVGGTSTDIGVLVSGFPRTSSIAVEIGGVETNFRMPDLLSIAVGGGTVIRHDSGELRIGPNSVGRRLKDEAQVFGGRTATLTDAAVQIGRARLGDRPPAVGDSLASAALTWSDCAIAEGIDRMKTTSATMPLIAVGGGSILLPEEIPGVSEIVRPRHHDVANAIGAAIASVSGHVDQLFDTGQIGRDAALEEARRLAVDEAVRLGADSDRTEVIDLEEFNVLYLSTTKLRIRAKAAGPLSTV